MAGLRVAPRRSNLCTGGDDQLPGKGGIRVRLALLYY